MKFSTVGCHIVNSHRCFSLNFRLMTKMFGESWDAVIAANKVYNAKDAAVKLGLDSAGINAKWGQLKRGEDLIKFGGGK